MKSQLLPRASLVMLLALTLIACGESKPTPTGVKTALKLNLKKGDSKKIDYDMDMSTSVKAQGKKMDMDMKMGFGMTFDVLDVDAAGLHHMKVTYDAVRMNLTGGPAALSYDSTSKSNAAHPATQFFDAMVGASITMKMAPDGTTTDIDAADFVKRMGEAGAPDQATGQIKSLEQSLQQFATYPKVPIDLGDTWTSTMDMASDPNMPMKVDATYMLMDRKDGAAHVKIDGTMKATNGGLAGTMNGIVQYDEATGWIKSGNIKIKMSGDVNGTSMSMEGTATMKGK